jgi:predicted dehydrogenase
VFPGVSDLLEASHEYDAILIAASIEGTLPVLRSALETKLPILVEKPVSYRSEELLPLICHDLPVIVGYNRRFYRPVLEARKEARNGSPLIAHLTLPERVSSPNQPSNNPCYLEPVFANSVHGFDLARFVLGELRIIGAQRLANAGGALTGVAALFTTDRGDILQLTCNWQTPANFGLTLDRPGRRFELKPFESSNVYEGMEITEPTSNQPIRSYKPKLVNMVALEDVDQSFKPGFFAQAQALMAMVRGEDPGPAARIKDAHAALSLAEELVGHTFPTI